MPQSTANFQAAFKQGYLRPSRAFQKIRDFPLETGERPSPDWPPSAENNGDETDGKKPSPVVVLIRLMLRNRKNKESRSDN